MIRCGGEERLQVGEVLEDGALGDTGVPGNGAGSGAQVTLFDQLDQRPDDGIASAQTAGGSIDLLQADCNMFRREISKSLADGS